jgi:hypothetical protein
MSVVLIVLFVIALLITLAGLVLSPRTQARRAQNEYLVTSKGRRIVASTPIPARSRRTAPAMTAQVAPARRKASTLLEGTSADPPPAYQARARVRRASADLARPVRKPAARSASARAPYPGPWEALKDRLSTWQVAVPGLIAIFLLGFYLLNTALPYPLIWMPVTFGTSNPSSSSAPSDTPVYAASKHLVRLSQLDPAQYRSTQEFNLWAYSACSAASMTEVINSYNHTYKITDILEIEAAIHEITPDEGLLEEVGIQRTGVRFGFKTTWGHNLSLNQVIAAANSGTPVIVSFPPARYPGGHILVVRGGDSNYVYLADSSRLNWTQISRDRFMQLWAGFYAIMTPA